MFYISIFVTYLIIPSSSQEQQDRHDNSIPCMTIWQIYRDTQQPLEKKLHSANQGSNFLGDIFNNGYNVRALIQFRRESQLKHLKRLFSLRNRPTHFFINSTSVIRQLKRNQLSLCSIKINESKLISHLLPQSTVSHRSHSSSEANSSCYHRSDT